MNAVVSLGDAMNAPAVRTLSKYAIALGAFANHSHAICARAGNPKERLANSNDTSPGNAIAMNAVVSFGHAMNGPAVSTLSKNAIAIAIGTFAKYAGSI